VSASELEALRELAQKILSASSRIRADSSAGVLRLGYMMSSTTSTTDAMPTARPLIRMSSSGRSGTTNIGGMADDIVRIASDPRANGCVGQFRKREEMPS
jgi:hypothetical protein